MTAKPKDHANPALPREGRISALELAIAQVAEIASRARSVIRETMLVEHREGYLAAIDDAARVAREAGLDAMERHILQLKGAS